MADSTLGLIANVLIVSVALAGCALDSVPPVGNPWQLDSGNNRLTHVFSGIEFPGDVPGFTRQPAVMYDDVGRDVGVSYRSDDPATPIVLTVYVTMGLPMNAEAYMMASVAAMVQQGVNPDSGEMQEILMELPEGGGLIHGFHGSFDRTVEGTPVTTALWVFKPHKTATKIRITYPADSDEAREMYIPLLGKFLFQMETR